MSPESVHTSSDAISTDGPKNEGPNQGILLAARDSEQANNSYKGEKWNLKKKKAFIKKKIQGTCNMSKADVDDHGPV